MSLVLALLLAACSATPSPPPAVTAEAPAKATQPAAPAPKAAPAAPAKSPAPAAPPAKPSPPPAATARAAPPPLDLGALEQRLKDTSAIGVLTKLSLKNQVDDLIGKFRAFHDGSRPPTLTQLRPSFELLLMKVLSLLQDKDKALANDINASREAIWGVLTDKTKLAQYR